MMTNPGAQGGSWLECVIKAARSSPSKLCALPVAGSMVRLLLCVDTQCNHTPLTSQCVTAAPTTPLPDPLYDSYSCTIEQVGGWGEIEEGWRFFCFFFKNCDLFHEVESREKKDNQEWKQYWGHDCWHGNNYGLLFSWARSKVKSIQTPTNTHTYMHKTKNQCLATLLHLFSSLYVWDIIKLTYLTVCVCVLGGSVCLCVYVRVSIFFFFHIFHIWVCFEIRL